MSFFAAISQAAISAQSTIAQLCGAEAGANNVRLVDTGVECIGVFGDAQLVNIPQLGGGYRQRAQLILTITQEQLDVAPTAKGKVVRLDVTPPVTYVIDYVNTHGNLDYDLTLVKLGT